MTDDDGALATFNALAVSFDVETHLFAPGLLAPPLVCGSTANPHGATLLDAEAARTLWRRLLRAASILVGANIAYDNAVMLADAFAVVGDGEKCAADLFKKYDVDEVFDVQIAEALNAIAGGHLFKDHLGAELVDENTGQRGRYNLNICVQQVLKRYDAKKNDFWRKRYAILERVPMHLWPEDARQYPVDDAINARDVALGQARAHRNLHDMGPQARAAFALHLSCCEGLRSDSASIDVLEREALDEREHGSLRPDGTRADDGRVKWARLGFLGDEGKKDGTALKKRMARAYGATLSCPTCNGSGKIKNAKSKALINCTWKNCQGLPEERAEHGAAGCDGTGLDLSDARMLERTPTGGITAGRDALAESGDEDLMGFAGYQEDDRLLSVYVPFLRKGQDAPLNPRSNVLVQSGRASYDEVFMQMPRDGGVRPCFVPRGFGTDDPWLFCSTDYSSGELCTLAQVALWVVGESRMAEVINETKDPSMLHTAMAGRMLGCTGAEVMTRIKAGDKQAADARQAAKPVNFGLPGGMGDVKLVLANRKKSAGMTVGPDGHVYRGIRFCILVAGAERCGVEMVTSWKGRDCSPVCKACLVCARDLKAAWLAQWPEMRRYFEHVSTKVDMDGELTQIVSDRVRGGLSFCDGANTLFQGLLADGAKRALWLIAREQYTDTSSPLYGTRTCAFFHDEVFSQMHPSVASAAAKRQAELMVKGLQEYCPDVFVHCEPALMRRWYKAAKPVWDADGNLIPWEPK